MSVEATMAEAAKKADAEAKAKSKRKVNGAATDTTSIEGLTYYADCVSDLGRDYVIKGVIALGELGLLTGESGCGKSWTAIDAALHVACGMNWHGRPTKKGGVVFVASEAGRSIKERVQAWRRYHGVKSADFAVYTEPTNLLDRGNGDRLLFALNAAKANFGTLALVVIDTLSRAMPGADENRPEGMTAAIGACDRIRAETGAALLLTHHLGKDGSRGPRGHSSLFAAADVELRIEDHVATIKKARHSVAGATFPFKLHVIELGRDVDGDPVTACVALPNTARTSTTGGTKAKGGKLKGQKALALSALKQAVVEAGKQPPLDGPVSVRAVLLETWRSFFYRDTRWNGGMTQEGKKKAFQRAREELVTGQHVIVRDGWCWPC